MKKVKRWRYYCDYCKKSGGNGHYMKIHEKGCTANPKRTCGFCDKAGIVNDPKVLNAIVDTGVKEYLENNLEFFMNGEKSDSLLKKINDDLIEEAEGCPACILTAIRQNTDSSFIDFDYKKAKKEFWDLNTQRPEPGDYY